MPIKVFRVKNDDNKQVQYGLDIGNKPICSLYKNFLIYKASVPNLRFFETPQALVRELNAYSDSGREFSFDIEEDELLRYIRAMDLREEESGSDWVKAFRPDNGTVFTLMRVDENELIWSDINLSGTVYGEKYHAPPSRKAHAKT